MTKRCNTNLIRIGIQKDWVSNWFSEQNQFFNYTNNDFTLYKFFFYNIFFKNQLAKMRIIRFSKNIILLFSVLNENEHNFDLKKAKFNPFFFKAFSVFLIFYKNWFFANNSFLIATRIGILLENKLKFRSLVIKKVIAKTKADNFLVKCKGRINGVEMAKKDFLMKGSIPFCKFKAKIDFSSIIVNTLKGNVSISVWFFSK